MNKHNLSTSNFKKNSIFVIKLFVGVILLFGYIYLCLPQYKLGYNASLIDKVNRLESIDGPKIVLIGNSNVAFGYNSEMLEDAMGVPVVNMGLHGGLGNAFHEEMAKLSVTPGDIYVISHTEFEDNNRIFDTMTAWSALETNFHLWKILRAEDIKTMVYSFPVYVKKSLTLHSAGTGNQDTQDVYSRNAFNEYGDVSVYRTENEYTFAKVSAPVIGDTTINRLNELNKYLTDRGATLVLAGCPFGNGNVTDDMDTFLAFEDELESRLDCPVISNYADYFFDYNYYYDTNFHMTTEGADLRTAQLIADLKRFEKNGTDASMEEDEYTDILADNNLVHVDDIHEYIDVLTKAQERYSIVITAKDDISAIVNPEIKNLLSNLGTTYDLSDKNYSYILITENGRIVFEGYEYEKLETSGSLDGGRFVFDVISAGEDRGSISSVVINEHEFSQNESGLNFVVYSNETHRVLDEVTFKSEEETIVAVR